MLIMMSAIRALKNVYYGIDITETDGLKNN